MSLKVIEEIQKQNIEPALEWALANEKNLEEIDSDLIFVLYQQKVESFYFVSLKVTVYSRSCQQWKGRCC